MAPGPELPFARRGRGKLVCPMPSLACGPMKTAFYRDADWCLGSPGRAGCGSPLLPLPSTPKVAAPSWPCTLQLLPNASCCHDSARLLLSLPFAGSAFCFLNFSLFCFFFFFQSVNTGTEPRQGVSQRWPLPTSDQEWLSWS